MKPTRLWAATPAKVNLGLEVLGRRADGYHDLVTLLQAITLFDTFEWTATGAAFEYIGPPDVPRDADLVWRALRDAPDLADWTGQLALRKRIPAAAGLGGGSSDAALALRLAFPRADHEELSARAARLGADVPFFLSGGAALARGIGTELSPAPPLDAWFVIVTPPLHVPDKTRTLYAGLRPDDFSEGAVSARLARDPGAAISATTGFPNAFARQLDAFPVVRYARTQLVRAGATFAAISGAGPSVFALTGAYAAAAGIAARLPRDVGLVSVARACGPRDALAARRIAAALRGRMEPCGL